MGIEFNRGKSIPRTCPEIGKPTQPRSKLPDNFSLRSVESPVPMTRDAASLALRDSIAGIDPSTSDLTRGEREVRRARINSATLFMETGCGTYGPKEGCPLPACVAGERLCEQVAQVEPLQVNNLGE